LGHSITPERTAAQLKEVVVAVSSRFTRVPKVHDLVQAGVPTEVIPTYCALADYANNKTGVAWPKMATLARRLKRTPRTIQRHLHLLQDLGLIEFVRRLRDERGRFGAYAYRLVHIAAVTARKGGDKVKSRAWSKGSKKRRRSTGHGGRVAPLYRTKQQEEDIPQPPDLDKRAREAKRRVEDYEWLFD
jgi:DNA-binding transcriptional ArsR family regulator